MDARSEHSTPVSQECAAERATERRRSHRLQSAPPTVATAGSGATARPARRPTGPRSPLTWLDGTAASGRRFPATHLCGTSRRCGTAHGRRTAHRCGAAHRWGTFRPPLHSRTSAGPDRPLMHALISPWVVLLPVPVPFPSAPIAFHIAVPNTLVVPIMSLPAMRAIVIPPTGRHPSVKGRRSGTIEGPAAVIVARSIPTSLPRTPPPAPAEEDVGLHIGHNVDVGLGENDHLQKRREDDRWRKKHTYAHAHANLPPRGKWNESRHEQKQRRYRRFSHSSSFVWLSDHQRYAIWRPSAEATPRNSFAGSFVDGEVARVAVRLSLRPLNRVSARPGNPGSRSPPPASAAEARSGWAPP